MKKFLLALLLSCTSPAFAAGLFVIANSGVTLSADEITAVFKGDTEFAGSVKLDPTDNVAAQELFLTKVMDMDKSKYDAWWTKKSFRDGVNQPPSRGTDMEVIEFVKKTTGGIGYVTTQPPAGVKVIQQY
jgi:hypothetical protein